MSAGRAVAAHRTDGKEGTARDAKSKAPTGTAAAAGAFSIAQRQSLAPSKGSRSEAESLYERYRSLDKSDVNGDVVGPKGLHQLFADLGITEDTLEMYVVLWRLGATRGGSVTRSEWLVALYTYHIEQITQFRLKITEWTAEVKENKDDAFTVMYNFLYDYIRGEVDRQMTAATATAAWAVLFKSLDPKLTQSWLRWVSEKYHGPISRDLWRQAWLFLSEQKGTPGGDAAHDAGKWPSAIDDYVAWCKSSA